MVRLDKTEVRQRVAASSAFSDDLVVRKAPRRPWRNHSERREIIDSSVNDLWEIRNQSPRYP